MTLTTQHITLQHRVNHDWAQPNPLVGSGFDIRSSENALLAIMYGSIERAAMYDWCNAGRTLVDKTYLHILWQAKKLPSHGLTHHDIAPQVERFIREQLQPIWPLINQLNQPNQEKYSRHAVERSTSLVTLAAQQLFGSNYQEQAASWLLFYLCPQLPIFPLSPQLLMTTNARDYDSHSKIFLNLMAATQPLIALPPATYGTAKEQAMINTLLLNGDWWQRYCLVKRLQTDVSHGD